MLSRNSHVCALSIHWLMLFSLATSFCVLLVLAKPPNATADEEYFDMVVPDTPAQAGLPGCGDSQVLAMVHAVIEHYDPQLNIVSVKHGVQNNRAKFFAFETGAIMEKARFCQAMLTYAVDKYMLIFYRVRWRDVKPNEAGVELYHAIELF